MTTIVPLVTHAGNGPSGPMPVWVGAVFTLLLVFIGLIFTALALTISEDGLLFDDEDLATKLMSIAMWGFCVCVWAGAGIMLVITIGKVIW